MSVREGGSQPLASGRTAVEAGHLGRGSRLVDEDQPFGIEIERKRPVMAALSAGPRPRAGAFRACVRGGRRCGR